MAEAIDKHGNAIRAIGIYGTTAIRLDGPYSDLDMTFITRIDLGHESIVTTALGQIRNAVVAADRASFLWACQAYSEAVCRAICLLNRRYVTGRARLRDVTKQLPVVPDDFGLLIDTVSGAQATNDQETYDAAEALWAGIGDLQQHHQPAATAAMRSKQTLRSQQLYPGDID